MFAALVQLRLCHLLSQLSCLQVVQLLVRSVAQLALSLASTRKTYLQFKVYASFVKCLVILGIICFLSTSASSSSLRLVTKFGTRGIEGHGLLYTIPVISVITPRLSVSKLIQRVAARATFILILLCLFIIVFSIVVVCRSGSSNNSSRDLTILTNSLGGIVDQQALVKVRQSRQFVQLLQLQSSLSYININQGTLNI